MPSSDIFISKTDLVTSSFEMQMAGRSTVSSFYALHAYLLQAGCQVAADRHGRTLLHQTALSGHLQMAQYLVMHQEMLSLDVSATDHDGRNALFYW